MPCRPYPSTTTVIWLNEKTEDFALYGELEKAFFLNHRKLDVSCIVERDLFGNHLEANPNVCEAAPDFKIGTLAAVAGMYIFSYFLRMCVVEMAIVFPLPFVPGCGCVMCCFRDTSLS